METKSTSRRGWACTSMCPYVAGDFRYSRTTAQCSARHPRTKSYTQAATRCHQPTTVCIQVLNVFQAQYTLAFEKLLATPEPWLYAHVRRLRSVD